MAALDATLTVPEALHTQWDACVIGAGLAGLTVAHGLALTGSRVLLVDKAGFPRYKICGGCLNATAIAHLEQLGLSTLLGDAPVITQFELHRRNQCLKQSIPPGRAIVRREFDAALLSLALRSGVAWLPQTAARVQAESVMLEGTALASRLIVDARGLAGADKPHPHSRIGVGAIIEHADVLPHHTIRMDWTHWGYLGSVHVSAARLNLAAAIDASCIRHAGGLHAAMQQLLVQVAHPCAGMNLLWEATPPLTRSGHPGAGRLFRLGDAAGYVEPFTGEGMAWALAGAAALLPILASALQFGLQPQHAAAWAAWHHALRHRQRRCRQISTALRHRALVIPAMLLLQVFPQAFHHFSAEINAPWTPHELRP